MIPFDILSGKIKVNNYKDIEIRILELKTDGFSFRMPLDVEINWDNTSFLINFFNSKNYSYDCCLITDFALVKVEKNKYYNEFFIEIYNDKFTALADRLSKDYMEYIETKIYGDDKELMEKYTAYSYKEGEDFPESYDIFKKKHFGQIVCDDNYRKYALECDVYLTLDIDDIDKYLKMEMKDFVEYYFEKNYLCKHPFMECIKGIAIGNQYCEFLLPDIELLEKIKNKSVVNGAKIIFLMPPMKENSIKKIISYIDYIVKNQIAFRMVVNDWGMAQYIQEKKYKIELMLGVLLNKRRKDPRAKFMINYEKQRKMYATNNSNADFYKKYLQDYFGIDEFLYDLCDEYELEKGGVIIPFFQTNTSGYCVLNASVENSDRGKQCEIFECERHCVKKHFLYPESLSVVHRYNSLFGINTDVLVKDNMIRKIQGKIIILDLN